MRFATSIARCAALALLTAAARNVADAQSAQPGPQSHDNGSAPSVLRAGRVAVIRLDGALSEDAWRTADSISTFTQVEPREGQAATGRTVVKVLTSSDALIVGVRADQPPGTRVVAFARDRDASLTNEDHIRLVFDTYRDGRSGYVFAVNPNGARYDALITSQGEGESSDWDGIWEAVTTRTDSGWSAEIRIPLKTLLFRQGLDAWGFNVQRRIQALLETDRWATPRRQFMDTHVNRAGRLSDLPPFQLGRGLSIRPSLTSHAGYPAPATNLTSRADASLDATQRIRANSLASLTINTDFGETEVDTRRTNLTRFPLFFPEKRTFFLEGSDIFQFGLGTSDDVRGFHSRRIGLSSSREVPLEAGLKVNGREGGTNFGALVVRTGHADDPLLDTLRTENTMAVVRLQQNVLEQSSVGFLATAGDPLGAGHSWLAGPDLTYQTSRFRGDRNFLVGVWGLAMNRDSLAGAKRAWGGKIDYPNDLWDVALSYKRIDDGFEPSLGFVPRTGMHKVNFNVVYSPRPSRRILGLPVRQMYNEWENTLVTGLDGRWQSYQVFTAPVNWRLESGDRFEFNANPTGEQIFDPFEIADGVVIPAGAYHWMRYRLEAGLASKRRFTTQVTWRFGGFYTGRLNEYSATASWKPSSLFIVEFNGTRNDGQLPQGDFVQQVYGTRFRVNVSPDLQFNSYVQYDNASKIVGTNTRIRWTFAPVGDLFVVYNHNVRELLDASLAHRGYAFDSNGLLLKLQYAFRY